VKSFDLPKKRCSSQNSLPMLSYYEPTHYATMILQLLWKQRRSF
jgi:hypothetical protein